MTAVFKKYKMKRLLLTMAVFNATADPALTVGEDYIAAGETAVHIRTKNAELTYNVDGVSRELDDATLGFKPQLLMGAHFTIDAEIETAGSGAAGTKPAYGDIVRTAAFGEAISAGVSVTYTQLDDDSWPDATFYFYAAGRNHKLLNAQTNISWTLGNGAVPTYKITITGIYGGVVTGAIPTPTFTQIKPVQVCNQYTTFTLDSVEYALVNYTNDQKNEVNYTDIPGYEGVSIDDIAPEGEIEILCPDHADFDPFAIVRSEADVYLALSCVHGTTAGNILTFANPQIQILGVGYGEFEGKRTFKMPYGAVGKNSIVVA